ncbi:hypothetical protein D3C74_440460 [compost metagenome]
MLLQICHDLFRFCLLAKNGGDILQLLRPFLTLRQQYGGSDAGKLLIILLRPPCRGKDQIGVGGKNHFKIRSLGNAHFYGVSKRLLQILRKLFMIILYSYRHNTKRIQQLRINNRQANHTLG